MAVKISFSDEKCDICGAKLWCIGLQKDTGEIMYICHGCFTGQNKVLKNIDELLTVTTVTTTI